MSKIQQSFNPAVIEIRKHLEKCGEAMPYFGVKCLERSPTEKRKGKTPRAKKLFKL